MSRDVLRQGCGEQLAARPLCAAREALRSLEDLVGDRYRGLHTMSITTRWRINDLRGFLCGQIVDKRRARLCRNSNEYACSCARPIRGVQCVYVVVA